MAVMLAFLNLWYYFTSAYYIKLLFDGCFFPFSILRTDWYKVKNSELRRNCLPIHKLLFPSVNVPLGFLSVVNIYFFPLGNINFLLIWFSINSCLYASYRNCLKKIFIFVFRKLVILIFNFHTKSPLMIDIGAFDLNSLFNFKPSRDAAICLYNLFIFWLLSFKQ